MDLRRFFTALLETRASSSSSSVSLPRARRGAAAAEAAEIAAAAPLLPPQTCRRRLRCHDAFVVSNALGPALIVWLALEKLDSCVAPPDSIVALHHRISAAVYPSGPTDGWRKVRRKPVLRTLATSGWAHSMTVHVIGQEEGDEYSMRKALSAGHNVELLLSDGYLSEFGHIPFGEGTRVHWSRSGGRSGRKSGIVGCCSSWQYDAINI